jgi:hypothetical protein
VTLISLGRNYIILKNIIENQKYFYISIGCFVWSEEASLWFINLKMLPLNKTILTWTLPLQMPLYMLGIFYVFSYWLLQLFCCGQPKVILSGQETILCVTVFLLGWSIFIRIAFHSDAGFQWEKLPHFRWCQCSMWLIWSNWHYEHIRVIFDQVKAHFHIVLLFFLGDFK